MSQFFGYGLVALVISAGLIAAGFYLRVGWSLAGHLLYKWGVRDVCSQTTIQNNGSLIVNGEERGAPTPGDPMTGRAERGPHA